MFRLFIKIDEKRAKEIKEIVDDKKVYLYRSDKNLIYNELREFYLYSSEEEREHHIELMKSKGFEFSKVFYKETTLWRDSVTHKPKYVVYVGMFIQNIS